MQSIKTREKEDLKKAPRLLQPKYRSKAELEMEKEIAEIMLYEKNRPLDEDEEHFNDFVNVKTNYDWIDMYKP